LHKLWITGGKAGLHGIHHAIDVRSLKMSRAAQQDRTFPLRAAALLAVSLAIGWVWLVAGTHLHEMIVGAAVVAVASLFLLLVHRSQPNAIQFDWKDVAQGWRIPWYMVSDTWVVTLVFFKDLLHLNPAGSYYRVCDFESNRDPAILGRGVLATIYMTATPNTIAIGIDPKSSRLLFHQLQPTDLPEMARKLGAQP
jgi:multisubunit Na+/H+ antiporter MnhE subunit